MAAMWRHNELEALLGGALLEQGQITEDGLRALVDKVPAESEWVEYKSKNDFKKPDDAGSSRGSLIPPQERAKDVCAAANARGALLIYGVEDVDNEPNPDLRMQPFKTSECSAHGTVEKIRADVGMYAAPVPHFDVVTVTTADGEGYYIVVVIPPSSLAPHAVIARSKDNRKSLHYFLRQPGQTHSRYLNEYEVAEKYQTRARAAEERRDRLAAIWSEGCEELTSPSMWLTVAAVPEFLAPDDRLTPQAAADIKRWENEQPAFPELLIEEYEEGFARSFPAPGKVVYTQEVKRDDWTTPDPRGSYRELHASGASFMTLPLHTDIAGGQEVGVDVDAIVDVVQAITRHSLDWLVARTGRWGGATVRVGIVAPGVPHPFTVQIVDDVSQKIVNRTRRLDAPRRLPSATVVVDLRNVDTVQDQLAAAYNVALPIVQAFGIAEPNWITDTGAINTCELLQRAERKVRAWADLHGVQTDDAAR